MLDKNLKSELIKAYNNVSKTSKVEFNQQNLDELIKLFHDNQYLSIMFMLTLIWAIKLLLVMMTIKNTPFHLRKQGSTFIPKMMTTLPVK